MSAKDSPRTMNRKQSMVLPSVVKENISVKTLKLLGDKKLMPRAARKRLGSSLSGKQLHEYIEAMKHDPIDVVKIFHTIILINTKKYFYILLNVL